MSDNWITIGGNAQSQLQQRVEQQFSSRLSAGKFTSRDVDYIRTLKRPLLDSTASLSPSKLEKLRRLCQLWDIEFRAVKITSHRRVIGPLVVGVKRLYLPLLRVLLKDLIRQQRDFNAAAISLLAELSNEDSSCAHKPGSPIIK